MPINVRRLTDHDGNAYLEVRLEGLQLQDREFRTSYVDERDQSADEAIGKLNGSYVAGAFDEGKLVGIAGLTIMAGAKLSHRALLWGMYIQAPYRSSGVSDMIMRDLMNHARNVVESVVLTVVDDNERAVRFYQRWGFEKYATDTASVRRADGSYLDEALMINRMLSGR